MTIGFDAKRIFHNKSGLGAYSRSLVRHLISHHPSLLVHLYTPPYTKNHSTQYFENQPNVFIHELPLFSSLWRTFLLPFITQKHKLDIFHGLSGELPFFSFGPKIKTVLTVHDVIFNSHPEFYTFWNGIIYITKLRWSLKKANQVIAISQNTKSEIRKYYDSHNDIKVIYPFINHLFVNPTAHLKLSEFKILHNLRNGYILYVGSLKGRKNIDVLLEALFLMDLKKRKKVIFITHEDTTQLMIKAQKWGVEDWVRAERNVDDVTLSMYYYYCNAVVYPSVVEGFGLPILEGLAHGAKVVCSEHPAHREAGGEIAIYFDPHNAQELSGLLSSLSYHERKSKKATLSHLNMINPSLLGDELMRIYAQE